VNFPLDGALRSDAPFTTLYALSVANSKIRGSCMLVRKIGRNNKKKSVIIVLLKYLAKV
jgi:hypothetical protein